MRIVTRNGWMVVAGCVAASIAGCAMERKGEAPSRIEIEQLAGKQDADAAALPAIARRIVYTASVDLEVKSVDETRTKLDELMREHDAFLAGSDVRGMAGGRRRATWILRVPVKAFDPLLVDLGGLGRVEATRSDSKDVTEEYYDVEARIGTKQLEEKRLAKHLVDSTGKLEEILAVERELSRVRGEIEQLQGRMRVLANLTSLSTITLTALEREEFLPSGDGFIGTLGRTLNGSIALLVDAGKGLVIASVAVAPWLVVAFVGLWSIRFLWRARRRAAITPST